MASTFANNACNWYVRTDGNALNGCGFDGTVAGAGTNYCDQAAPQVSSATGTCTVASTTWTDASATFTSLMKGNVLRISAATGGTATALDYFVITGFTDLHNIVLDRSPCATANITAATYCIGGAAATIQQFAVGGSGTGSTPTLASPCIPGNTVNIRGSGTQDPSAFDYDLSSGYYQWPKGNNTATTAGGSIKWVGYNGRPYIKHCGMVGFTNGAIFSGIMFIKNIKFVQTLGTWGIGDTHSLFDDRTNSFYNCIFDAGGFATQILDFGDSANRAGSCVCCEIRNPAGGTAATTGWGIKHFHGGGFVFGTWIHAQRQHGIVGVGVFGSHIFTLVNANLKYGYNDLNNDGSKPIPLLFLNCTFDANTSGAMNFATGAIINNIIANTVFSNHITAATSALTFTDAVTANAQNYRFIQYNDYFNNTLNFNAISTVPTWAINRTVDAGLSGDLTLDPQYVNAAGSNFTTGANLSAKGLLWCSNFTTTPATVRIGAII